MNISDIIVKLAEVEVEADEKLIQKCLDAGWIINSDEDILLLAQSITEQREQQASKSSKSGKLARTDSKKNAKAGEGDSKAGDSAANPGALAVADEAALDDIDDQEQSGSNQGGISNLAKIVDQELTVIKEELLAGSHEFAEGYSDQLLNIVLNTSDLAVSKFNQKAGGSQARLSHFRNRGKELSAKIFG